jgi:hypothetical protein
MVMLSCRLLGPVEVWIDDTPIDLGYPRQRTLLAIGWPAGRTVLVGR